MKRIILGMVIAAATSATFAAKTEIKSDGTQWPQHMQGVCTDGKSLWWSHTTVLAKTDLKGRLLAKSNPVRSHHGDLCIAGGVLYVAVNHGEFNTEDKADSWVYAYNPDTLEYMRRWKVPELVHGAGGMTFKDGKFYVIGGLPPTHDENYVYEYTEDFKFVRRIVLNSGWTSLGIQTVDWNGKDFLFGCYGGSRTVDGKKESVVTRTLVCPPDLSSCRIVDFDSAVGVIRLDGRVWVSRMKQTNPDFKAKGEPRYYAVRLVPAPVLD